MRIGTHPFNESLFAGKEINRSIAECRANRDARSPISSWARVCGHSKRNPGAAATAAKQHITQQSLTKVLLQAISCIGNKNRSLNNYFCKYILFFCSSVLLLLFGSTRPCKANMAPPRTLLQLLNKLIKITSTQKGNNNGY